MRTEEPVHDAVTRCHAPSLYILPVYASKRCTELEPPQV